MVRISLLVACLFVAGCSTATHVIVGQTRTPTNPDSIRVYFVPPAHYEVIALIDANSMGQLHATAQGNVDGALKRLKADAASLGANGILLSGFGDGPGNSVTTGFATVNGNSATGFAVTSHGRSKAITGQAIWVE